MIHFDEMTGLLYLEGQLGRPRSAELAAHAAACADCRALLHALERESLLLGRALVEQDEPVPARLLATPSFVSAPWAAASAPWAWILSFAMAATAAYTFWTGIVQPVAEQMDRAGFQGSSLLTMLFFSGAFWEGWGSMWNTLQYVILTSLGLLVLALWRPRWRGRTTIAIVVSGLALLLGLPSGATASEIRRGPAAGVAAGETIDNDLIVMGTTVRIDGTVKGDVIAFTQDFTVNGHVTGDVIVFAQMARVNGRVDGNVRAFCDSLWLDNSIGKNLTGFAAHVTIEPQAAVGGGAIVFAGDAGVQGKVTRDLLFFVGNTTLDGSVGGDILLRGQRLQIGPTAEVAGRVHVVGDRRPDVAPGAKLAQALEFEFRPQQPRFRAGTSVFRQILAYVGAFLCGLLLIKLFPGLFAAGREATNRVGLAMSIGALVLVAGIALVIFAVLLLLVGTAAGFATLMLYGPIFYGSQVFVGSWVGEMILGKGKTLGPSPGGLALGLLILRLLSNIPFFGFFVLAAVLIWGTGAICMALWDRTRLDAAPAAA